MAYRIVRSPERRVFYIDVGNIPPTDIEQYMQKVMTSVKRNQVVDPASGRVDLRYNPMSVDEDYFIPTRAGSSSRVESLLQEVHILVILTMLSISETSCFQR